MHAILDVCRANITCHHPAPGPKPHLSYYPCSLPFHTAALTRVLRFTHSRGNRSSTLHPNSPASSTSSLTHPRLEHGSNFSKISSFAFTLRGWSLTRPFFTPESRPVLTQTQALRAPTLPWCPFTRPYTILLYLDSLHHSLVGGFDAFLRTSLSSGGQDHVPSIGRLMGSRETPREHSSHSSRPITRCADQRE